MSRARLACLAGGVLLAFLIAAPGVRAANEAPTRISIAPLEPITVGEAVTVVVALTLESGAPVADKPVTLTIDGGDQRRLLTDVTGLATFRLPRDMAPREYALRATYPGETDVYLGATAPATLVIVPFELAVETVPPLPGMVFELDGTRFVAGDDGVARIPVGLAGDHELSVLDSEYRNPDQRVEFSRWNTEFFGPRIPIRIPYHHTLQAGFDVSFRASQTFVDSEGGVVDPARVTSLTLRNSLGMVLTYSDGQSRWYKTSRIVRRPTGLQQVGVHYTLESVVVDGSNVVNSGQDRFNVAPNDDWEIELLLFSAQLLPNDALFGFPIGDAVTVTYPDGRVVRLEAEASGELWARWLARGQYRVTVADAPGWAPVMPVALSRDQEVELRVISYLDMAVAVFAAVGLAIGLLHVGRPHLVPRAVGAAGVGVATFARRRGRIFLARGRAGAGTDAATGTTAIAAVASMPLARAGQRVPLLPALMPVQTLVVHAQDRPAEAADASVAADASASSHAAVDTPTDAASPEGPAAPVDLAQPASPRRVRSSRARAKGGAVDNAAPTPAVDARADAGRATSKRGRGAGTPTKPRRQKTTTASGTTATRRSTASTSRAKANRAKAPATGKSTRASGTATPQAGATTALRSAKPTRTARPSGTKITSTAPSSGTKPTARKAPARPRGTRKPGDTVEAKTRPVRPAAKAKAAAQGTATRAAKMNGRAGSTAKAKRAPTTPATAGGRRRPGKGSVPATRPRRTLIPVPMTLSQEKAVLEERRRQLVSLGLDDPGGGPISTSDQAAGAFADAAAGAFADAALGTAPGNEIAICRGCGLTLWVGARFCRRCGRVQEMSESAPPAPAPAVAGGRRPKRARRGVAS